jgi:hypothetical protein
MRRGGYSQVIGDQDIYFDQYQNYFRGVQTALSALPLNGEWTLVYGDGLSITCDANDQLINHIAVDGATMSKVNWYILNNCNFGARWIIDITGEEDVEIKGSPFPGIIERCLMNVLGSGRKITVSTGAGTSILGPDNTLFMENGVTRGLVIVGDVEYIVQANLPNCFSFKKVQLSTRSTEISYPGWKKIYVVIFNGIQPGDMVCFDGECQKVIAIEEGDGKKVLVLANPLQIEVPADSFITAEAEGDRTTAAPGAWTGYEPINGATSVALAAVLMVLIAQFL